MSKFIWLGVFLGGLAGGFIPSLWGADYFSMAGTIWSTIGGLVGIWLGYKVYQNISS